MDVATGQCRWDTHRRSRRVGCDAVHRHPHETGIPSKTVAEAKQRSTPILGLHLNAGLRVKGASEHVEEPVVGEILMGGKRSADYSSSLLDSTRPHANPVDIGIRSLQPQRGVASTARAGIRWNLQAGWIFCKQWTAPLRKRNRDSTAHAHWALWVDYTRGPAQTFSSLHCTSKRDDAQIRSDFGSRATSCSNVRGDFPVHERFWLCLVQVSTAQFCSFSSFLMSRMSDGANVPISSAPASSSNLRSSDSSGSDLNGTGTRPGITTDEKLDALLSQFAQFKEQIAQIPTLTNWMSRMDSHFTRTLGDFATRLTEMEQNFSTLTARMCKVETYAASASNVSRSARSWPTLEQVDGSTAAVTTVSVLRLIT